MGSNTDTSAYPPEILRIRRMIASYPQPAFFGNCDCSSYTFFCLGIIFVAFGAYLTIPYFMSKPFTIFNMLEPRSLIGPLIVCIGTMLTMKSIMDLRKKSVIEMMIRRRAILLGVQEIANQQRHNETSITIHTNGSTSSCPPPYEFTQERPPTYSEAVKNQPPPIMKKKLLEDAPKGSS